MNVFLFQHFHRIAGVRPKPEYEEFLLKENALLDIMLTEISDENIRTESDNILFEDGNYMLQENWLSLATE